MDKLPDCGLYRTTRALGEAVPAGRLVYFHNHGEPSAGVYLPAGWSHNRAQWHSHGTPVADPAWVGTLERLMDEGLYRVREGFSCCEKNCRTFEAELLVQLGYNALAEPILFVPEWAPSGLAFPLQGSPVDKARLAQLAPLKVTRGATPSSEQMH